MTALADGGRALAGGTELVPLLKEGLVSAERLVDVTAVLPRGISEGTIGAGATLAELEVDPQIPAALREACRLAASPQLRNMGTIGGNLLQATRCWYWRLDFPCYLHGGDRCHAKAGQHREHAFFGNELCLGASVGPGRGIARPQRDHSDRPARAAGRGAVPIADPGRPHHDDTRAGRADPRARRARVESSVYLKAMDRKRWSFALVGVAAARVGGQTRIALSGAAPVPWLLESLDSATPLPGTAYKVEIARALADRAVAAL